MAGLYIHIPFCKKKCAYCDFFSVANLNYTDEFLKAIVSELVLQKSYLENESINTIYFGGGTPSVLKPNELHSILNTIYSVFKIDLKTEITLEANPDDLSKSYLNELQNIGINRLSIGVQSFNDSDLQLMKRRHTSEQARQVIHNAREAGFKNISVDLIYGLPNMLLSDWEKNIDILLNMDIQHISAYHLTIEPNTVFKKLYDNNKIPLPTDDESIEQFKLLIEKTKQYQFIHYEISNFAKDGYLSLHNSNYWKKVKYLGAGPSAHSYNLTSRQWNISSLKKYLSEISKGNIPFEIEKLSTTDKYNDYIVTSLRTMWGINLKTIEKEFGKLYFDFILREKNLFVKNNLLVKNNDTLILSEEGKFLSDQIIRALLYI
ncbi:MAG: hypothetical protein A2X13_11720 [Bacteroidetes bacterium GWC2_33_15]|nr:MAG: hypothetical protein A2X10_05745 [Bacteroidetes bacterium GWA2_33_15]OFX50806.1 MAG: hypothetical protein A2X13_11720 [Bacteroidetes bacterium GWC2_33_15]OFX62911.1 MAG: hypothetical protein A2X15_09650 [Bacteroidetes bacterium GWB2_32_14]OFX69981.1 MAG: hypothetical protein A2X14_02510 [Bacteroidetes bacterium GWD2_33_33]HAN18977.1 coproporphyrinogen III oxidase [Bacteroidales bacterium]